jgi:hypothetical protein
MRVRLKCALLSFMVMIFHGCTAPGPIELDVALPKRVSAKEYFSFSLPENMTGSCFYGVDSYLGEFTTGSTALFFDLGSWSNDLSELSTPQNTMEVSIGGKYARITLAHLTAHDYDTLYPYFAGVHFPLVNDTLHMKLTMTLHGKNQGMVDTAMAVFHSIRFGK